MFHNNVFCSVLNGVCVVGEAGEVGKVRVAKNDVGMNKNKSHVYLNHAKYNEDIENEKHIKAILSNKTPVLKGSDNFDNSFDNEINGLNDGRLYVSKRIYRVKNGNVLCGSCEQNNADVTKQDEDEEFEKLGKWLSRRLELMLSCQCRGIPATNIKKKDLWPMTESETTRTTVGSDVKIILKIPQQFQQQQTHKEKLYQTKEPYQQQYLQSQKIKKQQIFGLPSDKLKVIWYKNGKRIMSKGFENLDDGDSEEETRKYKCEWKNDSKIQLLVTKCVVGDSGIYGVEVREVRDGVDEKKTKRKTENSWDGRYDKGSDGYEEYDYMDVDNDNSSVLLRDQVRLEVFYDKPFFTRGLEGVDRGKVDDWIQNKIENKKELLRKKGFCNDEKEEDDCKSGRGGVGYRGSGYGESGYGGSIHSDSSYDFNKNETENKKPAKIKLSEKSRIPVSFTCDFSSMSTPHIEWYEEFRNGRKNKINWFPDYIYKTLVVDGKTAVLKVVDELAMVEKIVKKGKKKLKKIESSKIDEDDDGASQYETANEFSHGSGDDDEIRYKFDSKKKQQNFKIKSLKSKTRGETIRYNDTNYDDDREEEDDNRDECVNECDEDGDDYEMELTCKISSSSEAAITSTKISTNEVWPSLLVKNANRPLEASYGDVLVVEARAFGIPKPIVRWFLNHRAVDGGAKRGGSDDDDEDDDTSRSYDYSTDGTKIGSGSEDNGELNGRDDDGGTNLRDFIVVDDGEDEEDDDGDNNDDESTDDDGDDGSFSFNKEKQNNNKNNNKENERITDTLKNTPPIIITTNCQNKNEIYIEKKIKKKHGDKNKLFFETSSQLLVKKMDPSKIGMLTVLALSSSGSYILDVPIRVKPFRPVFKQELSNQAVTLRDEVCLSCHVISFPEAEVTWWKNGLQLNHKDYRHSTTKDKEFHRLVILKSDETDAGKYECRAVNTFGTETSTCFITVVREIDCSCVKDETEKNLIRNGKAENTCDDNGDYDDDNEKFDDIVHKNMNNYNNNNKNNINKSDNSLINEAYSYNNYFLNNKNSEKNKNDNDIDNNHSRPVFVTKRSFGDKDDEEKHDNDRDDDANCSDDNGGGDNDKGAYKKPQKSSYNRHMTGRGYSGDDDDNMNNKNNDEDDDKKKKRKFDNNGYGNDDNDNEGDDEDDDDNDDSEDQQNNEYTIDMNNIILKRMGTDINNKNNTSSCDDKIMIRPKLDYPLITHHRDPSSKRNSIHIMHTRLPNSLSHPDDNGNNEVPSNTPTSPLTPTTSINKFNEFFTHTQPNTSFNTPTTPSTTPTTMVNKRTLRQSEDFTVTTDDMPRKVEHTYQPYKNISSTIGPEQVFIKPAKSHCSCENNVGDIEENYGGEDDDKELYENNPDSKKTFEKHSDNNYPANPIKTYKTLTSPIKPFEPNQSTKTHLSTTITHTTTNTLPTITPTTFTSTTNTKPTPSTTTTPTPTTTPQTTATLSAAVTPTTATLSSHIHFTSPPGDKSCSSGDSIAFECSVCTCASPTFKWYKNGKVLQNTPNPFNNSYPNNNKITLLKTPSQNHQSHPHSHPDHSFQKFKEEAETLIINHVTAEMAGKVVVVVESGGDEVACSVQLRVKEVPSSGGPNTVQLKDQNKKKGEGAVFSLPVSQDTMADWFFNENPLKSNVKYVITQNEKETELQIPNLTSWDAGIYRVNLKDDKHPHSSSAQLIVVDSDHCPSKSILKIESFPRDETLKEGEDVKISVVTSGSFVTGVKWFHNYVPISDKGRYSFALSEDDHGSNYSLFIYKALKQNSGLYSVKLTSDDDERVVSCYLKVQESKTEEVSYRLINQQKVIPTPACFFFNDCILTHDQSHRYKVVLEIECQHALKPFKTLSANDLQRRWFVKKAYVGRVARHSGDDDDDSIKSCSVDERGEALLRRWYVDSSTDYEYYYTEKESVKEHLTQQAMFKQQMVQVVVVLKQPRSDGVWFKDGVPLVSTHEENKYCSVTESSDGRVERIYYGGSDVNKYKGSCTEKGREHRLMVKDVGETDAGVYSFGVSWIE